MIQIDIPMPKNCGVCPICNEYLMCGVPCNGRGWGENDVSDYFTNGRPDWCPLKEQEAVSSEALKAHYGKMYKCKGCGLEWYQQTQRYCQHCGKAVRF